MKAILKFNLNNPEDKEGFDRINKSQDMALALWDICNIRKRLERKFENESSEDDDVFVGIQEFANEIGQILDEYSIDIDALIN